MILLSGGVDSSAVTAALAAGGHRPGAFTIGFSDADDDERPWAELVARHLGVELVSREVVAQDVEDVFRDTILWHFDEPSNDSSYLPTYYVSREARAPITVALSGEGSDEGSAGTRSTRCSRGAPRSSGDSRGPSRAASGDRTRSPSRELRVRGPVAPLRAVALPRSSRCFAIAASASAFWTKSARRDRVRRRPDPHEPEYEGTTRLPGERVDLDYTWLKGEVRPLSEAIARRGRTGSWSSSRPFSRERCGGRSCRSSTTT